MRPRSRFAIFSFLAATAFASVLHAQDAPPTPGSIVQAQPSASSQDTPNRIRIAGNVSAAQLLKQVQPVYPPIAKTAHISGTVVLHAIIAKDGTIGSLEYVSGPQLLMKSAMDAVKQWQYKPTLLNGAPVEVDTTISVVFTLGDSQPGASDSGTPPKPMDPQLKADISRLFELSGFNSKVSATAHTMFDSLRPAIMADLPPTPNREKIADAYSEKLAGVLQSQEFKDRMTAVFAKYFSDDEIKALIQFYDSPVGRRYNSVFPQFMVDVAQIGRSMAAENVPAIFRQLCEQFPELRGAAKFCPDFEKNKQSLLRPVETRTLLPAAAPAEQKPAP